MKTCRECKGEFAATVKNFYRDKSRKDGLMSVCKGCNGNKTHGKKDPDPSFFTEDHILPENLREWWVNELTAMAIHTKKHPSDEVTKSRMRVMASTFTAIRPVLETMEMEQEISKLKTQLDQPSDVITNAQGNATGAATRDKAAAIHSEPIH